MNGEESTLWLVVGLGNPGGKYEGTYHNLGRVAAALFASRQSGHDCRWAAKYKGEFCRVQVGESRVLVLLPDTYMNLSGEAVSGAARMYKVDPGSIVVVHDDLDLEPGYIRVRPGGGDGGHRGVTSCVLSLGSADFVRIRIGIGRHPFMDSADYVLSKIPSEHAAPLEESVDRAASAVESVITRGLKPTMNDFNRKCRARSPGGPQSDET